MAYTINTGAGVGGAGTGTVTLTGAGASSSPYTYTATGTSYITSTGGYNGIGINPILTTNSNQSAITVKGDAEFEGEVKIKGRDLGEFMETLEKRLAILQPDPKKLEKFEALRKAYDHYKLMEALCQMPEEDGEK